MANILSQERTDIGWIIELRQGEVKPDGQQSWKHQIPSTKFQRNTKDKIQSTKVGRFWLLLDF
jgi:hypothetical protein